MKGKIIKAFLTIISLLLISETFFLVTNFFVTNKYQQITDNLVSEYRLSKETSLLVSSFYDLIQYSNDDNRVRAFKNNRENLKALLSKLDQNLTGDNSWAVYLGVKNTINSVINEANTGVDNISAGNFTEVTNNYLKAAQDDNFVKENTGTLLLKELEGIESTQADIAKTKYWSELIGLVLFGLVALGSVLYSFLFLKKLISPLRRLAKFAKKIGAGDYSESLDVDLKTGGDELATLAESLDTIAASLKSDDKKIKTREKQLIETQKFLSGEAEAAVEDGEAPDPLLKM